MTIELRALRQICLALTLAAACAVGGVRAEDTPAPPQPSDSPSAQTPGGQRGGGGRANKPPAVAEQHKLPPDLDNETDARIAGAAAELHRHRRP